jgi:hypothetical protein
MRRSLATLWMAILVCLGGCVDGSDYAQATAVLVDVSGTYAEQKEDVVRFIRAGILPDLLPGDSLMLIRIDDLSYEQSNLVASVKLDMRPSHANAHKLAFANSLAEFSRSTESAGYTDIRGAMMLAADYLKETGAKDQNIIVFSDLEEDLPRGATRKFEEHEFDNIRVLAMNVKKLGPDNRDPSRYRERLALWEKRVLDNGASEWHVILTPTTLVDVLNARRS